MVYDRVMAITLKTFNERVTWLLNRPEHGDGMSQKQLGRERMAPALRARVRRR